VEDAACHPRSDGPTQDIRTPGTLVTHSHACTNTHTHAQTCAHIHTYAHTYAYTHARMWPMCDFHIVKASKCLPDMPGIQPYMKLACTCPRRRCGAFASRACRRALSSSHHELCGVQCCSFFCFYMYTLCFIRLPTTISGSSPTCAMR
jgi:hypothetical protein